MTRNRVAALLALTACGAEPPRFVALERPGDLVLPLLIDLEGRPARLLPPFGSALEAVSSELLVTAHARLVVISAGLDDVAGEARPWEMDLARLAALRLTTDAPSTAGAEANDPSIVVRLPSAARFLILDPDARELISLAADTERSLRAVLGLSVPVLVEPCRVPGIDALSPFPVTGLPPVELKKVRIIDRDRLLLGMLAGVALVERDGTWTGEPRQLISYTRGATEAVGNTTFDLSPVPEPDGARVGAALVETREPAGYRLIDFRVDAGGVWTTTTATLGAASELKELGFDHRGTLVMVGSRLFMTRQKGERGFVVRAPAVIGQNLFARTGDDAAPHGVAGDVEIATGDARTGSWNPERIPGILLRVDQLAFDPAREDAWMIADSLLYQRVERSWISRGALDYPRRFAPCLGSANGIPAKLNGIALSGDYFALATDCNALLLGRRAPPLEGCATVLPQPERPIEVRVREEFRAIDVLGGHLVAAGDIGWIFEAELPVP
ncbi:MAG: hypothetical protein IT384_31820 [Deltaproteobacteria bacterium]|nr:hypothetical protein [Deltaproteobacteria bacterium]